MQQSLIVAWRKNTEKHVQNATMFALALWFHPVYVAAAHLEWTKRSMIAMNPDCASGFPE